MKIDAKKTERTLVRDAKVVVTLGTCVATGWNNRVRNYDSAALRSISDIL